MVINEIKDHKLIIFIIRKGLSSKVIKSAKAAGAVGWTLTYGRGIAEKHIYENILGIAYEPEKEIIFIAVKDTDIDNILNKASEKVDLNKPGGGIAIVLDLAKCVGIAHLVENL